MKRTSLRFTPNQPTGTNKKAKSNKNHHARAKTLSIHHALYPTMKVFTIRPNFSMNCAEGGGFPSEGRTTLAAGFEACGAALLGVESSGGRATIVPVLVDSWFVLSIDICKARAISSSRLVSALIKKEWRRRKKESISQNWYTKKKTQVLNSYTGPSWLILRVLAAYTHLTKTRVTDDNLDIILLLH